MMDTYGVSEQIGGENLYATAVYKSQGQATSADVRSVSERPVKVRERTTEISAQKDQIDKKEIERVSRQLEALQQVRLAFEQDRETGEMVIRLRDIKSGEVIRQIPPEEKLRFMQRIEAYLQNVQAGSRLSGPLAFEAEG